MHKVVLLGSTGSIGESTLQVAAAQPESIRIVGLAARSSVERLIEQAVTFGVKVVAVEDQAAAQHARELASGHGIKVLAGADGVAELAAMDEAEIVVCALVGLAGLRPALAALRAGHDLALATKEVLVAAGELVMRERAAYGGAILPIDSEHNALFQCLQSLNGLVACVRYGDMAGVEHEIASLTLTASGGPFAFKPEVDFERVTPEEALAHPRWKMGPKVTIDSATMMNKGLEIVEAHWLFNVPIDRIRVVVHPESIVHSAVTFVDGSTLAQLSQPDMRFAIQYALSWPERLPAEMPELDLTQLGRLNFHAPDERRFAALGLIREAVDRGGSMPAVLNAADEVAVEAFLAGEITFGGICRMIDAVMTAHKPWECGTLDAVLEADIWARSKARELIGR